VPIKRLLTVKENALLFHKRRFIGLYSIPHYFEIYQMLVFYINDLL
jgi:hypothetical protein